MIDWDATVLAAVEGIFGQPATYRTRSGNTYALAGVFDQQVSDIDVTDGAPVVSVAPCFGFRVINLPVTAAQGDFLEIPAAPGAPLVDTVYIIREVRIDGHGWALLRLNLAP